MAKKTYIPGLVTFARLVIKYAGKYRAKVVEALGEEVATLLDLLIDIASIFIQVIEANSDAYGNYAAPVGDAVSSTVINTVRGAYNAFMNANGETGDV